MANLFGRDDIGIGIALPFGSGVSNFKLNYTTLDQARTNIVNLLLTHKGERFMQPDFGTNLRRFLFQPNTSRLEDEIKAEIQEKLPKIHCVIDGGIGLRTYGLKVENRRFK